MFDKIIKRYRLYRFKTALSILFKYWNSSKRIAVHVNAVSRFSLYIDMLSCLRKYGASDENYLQFRYYGKDDAYRNSFITWRRSITIMNYSPKYIIEMFLNKAAFNKRFAQYIKRGWLDCNHASEKQILDFIQSYSSVIIKPMDASCGVGVMKICNQDTKLSMEVKRIAHKNYIIEEAIENCPEIKEISPESLNTIRITTLMDKMQNVHVITTNLRVGNGTSITDNFCTGGICCCINPDSGCIEGDAGNLKDIRFKSHPTTGIVFNGYKIPHLKEAIELVRTLAKEEPEAKLVGWDIVITPDGIDLLEGNIPPAEEVIEFNLKGKWHFIKGLI